MLKYKIKTHKMGVSYDCPHFFILNKGNHSGKPEHKYWSNCFVFITETSAEKEFYFFVFLGLWELGYFKRALIGSAVRFIRIGDLTDIAEEAINNINTGNRNWQDIKGTISQLEEHKDVLQQKINRLIQIRQIMFYTFIKKKKAL